MLFSKGGNTMADYKRALMCAPHYYVEGIPAAENPHMTGKQSIDGERAFRDWTDLFNALRCLGLDMPLMPPVPERWDMPFTANGGLIHNGRALLSNFRWPIRRGEKKYFREALEQLGFSRQDGTLRELPDNIHWEGQGDVLDGPQGMIFHGWGFRSDYEALPYVRDMLLPHEKLIPVRLINPDFYHLDTCAMPIPIRSALAFWPGAFHADSLEEVRGLQIDRIEVSTLLAYCFALNSPVLGDTVLLNVPFVPPDECRKLSARAVPMDKADPRFNHLLGIDAGAWQENEELYDKAWAAARGSHPMFVDGRKMGYTEFVQGKLWARNLNVVPVYTSQFRPSGAGARCCLMLFE